MQLLIIDNKLIGLNTYHMLIKKYLNAFVSHIMREPVEQEIPLRFILCFYCNLFYLDTWQCNTAMFHVDW